MRVRYAAMMNSMMMCMCGMCMRCCVYFHGQTSSCVA